MGLGRQLFSALSLEKSSPLTHGQDEKLLLKVKIDFRSLLARVCVCKQTFPEIFARAKHFRETTAVIYGPPPLSLGVGDNETWPGTWRFSRRARGQGQPELGTCACRIRDPSKSADDLAMLATLLCQDGVADDLRDMFWVRFGMVLRFV